MICIRGTFRSARNALRKVLQLSSARPLLSSQHNDCRRVHGMRWLHNDTLMRLFVRVERWWLWHIALASRFFSGHFYYLPVRREPGWAERQPLDYGMVDPSLQRGGDVQST